NFLPRLIESLTTQTLRPERWIVIDDGSTDATAEILDRAAKRYPWIDVKHLQVGRERLPGGESILMQFLPREVWQNFDAILRIDADITFKPDFIDSMAAEFARDPKLGIAGSALFEPEGTAWREIRSPAFHTRGAVKMYSRQCFEAIGGLVSGLGWDTIDEARAMMLGYNSHAFRHIRAYHHRPQGSAGGYLKGNLAAGRAAYNVGYHPLFLMMRAAKRGLMWPPVIGGLFLLAGYAGGYLRRSEKIAPPELVKYIRRQQLRRLFLMESVWR
ncbi:MAG TPA: glycosyltransferase family A protein, partial [Candidatus Binataceae bacterium]|nr:glycosyltransferase family A protein [Candidatus Binataceae bacterium]